MKHILITGGAGFIGSTLADRALSDGYKVTAIDNFDPFYDRSIKQNNIALALGNTNYCFIEENMSNTDAVCAKMTSNVDIIVHLAAKAGVRYSISHPVDYTETNVNVTVKVCELARKLNVDKIIFSSSSSVYGSNPHTPWSENLELLLLSELFVPLLRKLDVPHPREDNLSSFAHAILLTSFNSPLIFK